MQKKQAAKAESGGEQATLSFEKALERLETIVAEMEGGKVGLEEMIRYFEEGQKLIALCTGKLNEVERRIEILVKKGDGVAAEPFDAGTDDEAAGSETKDSDDLF